jgi:hypothetical protein
MGCGESSGKRKQKQDAKPGVTLKGNNSNLMPWLPFTTFDLGELVLTQVFTLKKVNEKLQSTTHTQTKCHDHSVHNYTIFSAISIDVSHFGSPVITEHYLCFFCEMP